MKQRYHIIALTCMLVLCASAAVAQDRLPVREYTAPEELISMDATTTLSQAIEIFNNASKRFRGKPIIYDGESKDRIGLNITHQHWQDAMDLVLRVMDHWYEEREDFVRVFSLKKTGSSKDTSGKKAEEVIQTREVQISAVFFEANRTELERLGLDWFLTNATPSVGISQTTSTTGTTAFGADDQGAEGETQIEIGSITTLAYGNGTLEVLAALKALQSENLGELIASPNITVRSGEIGRIQVGQDFSVKQKDFSGNTTEKFFSTGTIIEVEPTVLQKDSIEFVNLVISAERSTFQPDPVSTIINKTAANTSVVLMNGEETVVGGLVTNEYKSIRRGIPFLKDLPWWVFGLRYVFGYEEVQVDKRELIIILRADIVPSVEKRMALKIEEIKRGQNALQRESQRMETLRLDLLRQIETAKESRD
ncbi:MAG: type II and III secretion system protein [Bacteroidota bacterium]|nr:type II and III secretion system protein [Bacteroidota bacterium]